MTSLRDLPVEKRFNSRLRDTDFGVTHRIDTFFEDKKFSDGFALPDGGRKKIAIISRDLQTRFFNSDAENGSDILHEPFYFACAAASLMECRLRVALTEVPQKSNESEVSLDHINSIVATYLQKNPYVDALIATYADRLGDPQEGYRSQRNMTFSRLFSGLTFFLLECENALEYNQERAIARGQAMFRHVLD